MTRAIMFHLGATKEPPPLPNPNEMSDQGIDFVDQCLSLDPEARPTASELLQDEWLVPMLEQMVSLFHVCAAKLVKSLTALQNRPSWSKSTPTYWRWPKAIHWPLHLKTLL